MALPLAAGLMGCSPYPDDGEFLAGVVYSANFISGVKSLAQTGAVGRGVGPSDFYPYTVVATTQSAGTTATLSSTAPATSPFWTNGGKRMPGPLDRATAGQVYLFDSSCAAPPDYEYDPRLDLIELNRQYPLFQDIPEVLSTNSGKPGRTGSGAYSAIVEVIHVSAPGNFPCQSVKRFDTAQGRTGAGGDLVEGQHEFRLFQVYDPAIAVAPLPFKLGFYNQLVVPYIDMGPVPLEPDGKTFRTMPLYKVTAGTKAIGTVVFGLSDEAGPAYSPICRDYNLTLPMGAMLPLDASDMAFQMAAKTENLSSCIVCRTLDDMGNLDCPWNSKSSQGTP